jgi:hypothetical protein
LDHYDIKFCTHSDSDYQLKESDITFFITFFYPCSALSILNTPLFPQVTTNVLVWKGEKNGKYYVCSAYRICTENIWDASHLRCPNHWKSIWNIKALLKVKYLVWRMFCGCFSTCARLVSREVICPIECVVCNEDSEDFVHALFTCSHATRVWYNTNLWNIIGQALSSYVEATTVVFCILQKLQTTQCPLFATILCRLWKRENFKLWQQVHETKVVECVVHMLEDWKLAQEMRTSVKTTEAQPQLQPSCTPTHRWKRPTPSRYNAILMLLSHLILVKLA